MDKHERGEGARSQRRCAQTYEIKANDELIRFVANDVGEVFPDVSARAPGRGVWITADSEILAAAIKANAFSKSLKRRVNPAPELIEQTKSALLHHCLDMLGFAKRSDVLILGADKIADFLKDNEIAFLIEANDGSAEARSKLLSRLAFSGSKTDIDTKVLSRVVGCFSTEQLSDKLGQPNCVHVAMKRGNFAANWRKELERLRGLMPLFDSEWGEKLNLSHTNNRWEI